MRVWVVVALFAAACGRIGFGVEGGTDASDAVPDASPYHDVTQPGLWTSFDVSQLGGDVYSTFAFDGRYLYPVPYGSLALRYDTRAPFAASSWQTFDLSPWNASANMFSGGAFDGRYVYFIPNQHSTIVRYDTTQSFSTAAAWEAFDVSTAVAGALGYGGAVFDGRYLVLVSLNSPPPLRYDTQAPFASAASWTPLPLPVGWISNYKGGTFDGTGIYMTSISDGFVVRGDAVNGFASGPNAGTMSLSTIVSSAVGFAGTAFDGRYVYVAENDSDTLGMVARYDPSSAFGAASSWKLFATMPLAGTEMDFSGAVFDGRYIYFIPGIYGLLARYDTTLALDAPSAWVIVAMSTLGLPAKRYEGGLFDGRYLYTLTGTTIARFDVRDPPALPAGWNHSFF
jgi:hypothetical protein